MLRVWTVPELDPLIQWLHCIPPGWLVILWGHCIKGFTACNTEGEMLKLLAFALSSETHPPMPSLFGMHRWILWVFEGFVLLFEFFYPSHPPSSHLVSNISVLYAISFLIRTILSPKAALDKTCSQKYNSINFIFPKKVGEFFQPLNPLLLPSLFPNGQGFLRKTAGRQWKQKTGIYE